MYYFVNTLKPLDYILSNGENLTVWELYVNTAVILKKSLEKRSLTSQGDRTEACTKSDLEARRYLVCDTAFQSNWKGWDRFI